MLEIWPDGLASSLPLTGGLLKISAASLFHAGAGPGTEVSIVLFLGRHLLPRTEVEEIRAGTVILRYIA